MPQLKIHLLGTPLIYWEDQPLVLQRKATRALLYYLAAVGGSVSRTSLTLLFWPDEAEETIRQRLRNTLGRLRSDLPEADLVLSGRSTLSMDFSKVWVDIRAFNELLEQVGKHPWSLPEELPLPTHYYQALYEAADLWNSSNLTIPEFSDYDALGRWWASQSIELQDKLSLVLTRLAQHERATGSLRRATGWYRRALEINPFDEVLNARLLTTLLGDGRRSDAISHYEAVTRLFADELNQPPSELITTLQSKIYSSPSTIHPAKSTQWPIRTSLQAPFTGRNEILQELGNYYHRDGATIIFGEAGIGKTRLVREFYKLRQNQQRLLMASCRPLDDNSPYHPWVDMLRNFVSQQEWNQLSTTWANILASFLPELADLRSDLSPVRFEGSARMRTNIMEAIHQVLKIAAHSEPIFVFIDDVQWADQSTLAVVFYLLEKGFFSPENGGLILASRIEESNQHLDELLLTIHHTHLHKIQLEKLEHLDVEQLVIYFFEQEVPEEFVNRLLDNTGGNPFFILETLMEILENFSPENIQQPLPANINLAKNVHQVIRRRWQRLPGQAIEVLQTAAILGSSGEIGLLELAVNCTPDKYVQILSEAEYLRLLSIIEKESGQQYVFTHENNHASLILEINRGHRKLLHQRVALATEKYHKDKLQPHYAQLAYHFEQAEMLSKAFDYWLLAAEYAHNLASLAEATENFVHAEHLIPRKSGLSEDQIYQLYTKWNDMAFGTDDLTTLKRINQTLLKIGYERSSDLLIGIALDGLSDAAMSANDFNAGYEYTTQALPYLEKAGNTFELADAINHQGVFLYMQGKMQTSQECFKRALSLIPDTDDPLLIRVRGQAKNQLSITQTLMGWPESGVEYGQACLMDAFQIQRKYDILTAYSVLGLGYYLLGDYQKGLEVCSQGIELSQTIESWRMLGYTHGYAALNACEAGYFGVAWRHAQAAIKIGQEHGHNEISALGFRASGDVYRNLFDLPKAIGFYQKGVDIAGEHFTAIDNLINLGLALGIAGKETGKIHLDQAITQAYQLDLGAIGILGKFARLYICIIEKDFETLRSLLPPAATESRQRKMQTHNLLAEQFKAILMMQDGHIADAVEISQAVANETNSMPCKLLARITSLNGLRMMELPLDEARTQIQSDIEQLKTSLNAASATEAWPNFLNVLNEQTGGNFE